VTQTDEIAAAFARKRAARATGEVNTSANWQVRIKWASPESVTWPTFSYDAKDTREHAEYCARQAMAWKQSDTELHVTGAWVRGPGASEWARLDLPAQQGAALASGGG
jgi:hypothetical protein